MPASSEGSTRVDGPQAGVQAPPLEGIRVVEIASLATAFAGRQLAELGADVVLVEPPSGAPTRGRAPYVGGQAGVELSLHHLHFNQGKCSVVLDLGSATGQANLRRLLGTADALIEGEAPGVMDGRGLGAEALWALHPNLHYVTITPFGQEGPFAAYRGTDLVCAASSGLLYLSGFPEDPPNVPGAEQAFHIGALAAVATLLVALAGDSRTIAGPGAREAAAGHRIDVSIQEAAAMSTLQTANANIFHWHGEVPRRGGLVPATGWRSLYSCRDGSWISFTVPVGAPALWPNLTRWLEEEGLVDLADPDWQDYTLRQRRPDLVSGVIAELCGRYPRQHLVVEGQRRRMLTMPVNTAQDLLELEQLREREFFATSDLPELGRTLTDVGPAYRFSETPARRGMSAPRLGEHTRAVLALTNPPPSESDRRATALSLNGAEAANFRPLEGIRVIDFFWMLAGPLTSRVLANYGADVIKVESESRTDTIRLAGVQPRALGSINTNGVFNDANVNKRSLQLNMKHPRGRSLLKELVARSDVVTNNFTPDRMDRWGLGYEELRKVRPDIIMMTMPVMGMTGPYRGFGSYGNGIIAYSGLSQNMGFAHHPPIGIGPLYSDFAAPYFAVSALMAALRHRSRSGRGQFIELAQSEAAINLLGPDILEVSANNHLPPRLGNRSRDLVPHGVYRALGEDRWIAVCCESDGDWQRLAEVIGRPDLARDERYRTAAGRRLVEDQIDALIDEWTATREPWSAMEELQLAGVPAAVVEDLRDVVTRDPHLSTRHLVPLRRPDDEVTFLTHAEPAQIDGRLSEMARAPAMGEHTSEVLRELLGLTDGDIADLLAAGVLT